MSKIVARECQNIEYKSRWGRSYKKIREGFEGADHPLPTVENFCGGVRVTFQRKNVEKTVVNNVVNNVENPVEKTVVNNVEINEREPIYYHKTNRRSYWFVCPCN